MRTNDLRSKSRRGVAGGAIAIRSAEDLRRVAFTLMEVMVATAIFFICVFAILGLVTNSLRNVQVLQKHTVDPGMLAGMTALTNKLVDGASESGDFEDFAPGSFPDYRWERGFTEVASNGLFRADLLVSHRVGGKDVESKMSILLFRPDSQRGPGMGIGPPGLRR
jgi:hypothetical protein